MCVCVCALVCMSVSQCQGACGGWGEGWLCVALTAPLHIKRLVPSGDLLVHNTAACAYVASFLFIALWLNCSVKEKKNQNQKASLKQCLYFVSLWAASLIPYMTDVFVLFVFFAIEPNPKTLNIIKILLYKNESKRISHGQKTSSLNVRKVIFNI